MKPSRALIVAAVTATALVGATAGVVTTAHASTATPAKPAAAAHHGTPYAAPPNKLTGYPNKINTVNLDGYQIVTSYPLGKLDQGSTYVQTYTATSVTAKAIAGPYKGDVSGPYSYVALPVTKNIIELVWIEPGNEHNSFVYNFANHESSVITYDSAGDPSLGSVWITKVGTHRIP